MTMLAISLTSHALALSLSLLHFLWQGTLIVLVALGLGRLLRGVSAKAEYGALAGGLLLLPMAFVGTFVALVERSSPSRESQHVPAFVDHAAGQNILEPSRPVDSSAIFTAKTAKTIDTSSFATPAPGETAAMLDASPAQEHETASWQRYALWFDGLYLLGVVWMSLRLLLGLSGGRKLCRQAAPVTESSLLLSLVQQCQRIGLKGIPRLAYCAAVNVPTVVGILRPMILLPAAVTSGLSMTEVDAILLHELAHIRRYDHWLNLAQRIVEAAFFFHPAVWFLSRRIRVVREHCCDDLVLALGCSRESYVESLLRVADLSLASTQPALLSLQATGRPSQLRLRVARLLGLPTPKAIRLKPSGMLFVGLLLAGLITAPLLLTAMAAPPENQGDNQPTVSDEKKAEKEAEQDPNLNEEKQKPRTLEEAIKIISSDESWENIDSLSIDESPVYWRMNGLIGQGGYTPKPADEKALLKTLKEDQQLDATAKLCVAGFLLELDNLEARDYLLKVLATPAVVKKDEQTEYTDSTWSEAAMAIMFHLRGESLDSWEAQRILSLVASNRFNSSGARWQLSTKLDELNLGKMIKNEPKMLRGKRVEGENAFVIAVRQSPQWQAGIHALDEIGSNFAIHTMLESLGGPFKDDGGRIVQQPDTKRFPLDAAIALVQRKVPEVKDCLLSFLRDETAVMLLGDLGDKSVLPELYRFTEKNPNVNAEQIRITVERLEAKDEADLIRRLTRILQDPAFEHSTRVIYLLGETKNPDVVDPIAKAMAGSKGVGTLIDSVSALEKVSGNAGLLALARMLPNKVVISSDPNSKPSQPFELNRWLTSALKRKTGRDFGEDAAKWEEYLLKLPAVEPKKQSNWKPTKRAIFDGTPPEVAALIPKLQSESARERAEAAIDLRKLKEEYGYAFPWLVDLMHDPTEEPSKEEIGNHLFVPMVITPAREAAKTLAMSGPKAFLPLSEALHDPDPWTRRVAAAAVGDINNPETARPLFNEYKDRESTLMMALKDRDPYVRAAMALSLARLLPLKERVLEKKTPASVDSCVVQMLAMLKDENRLVRNCVVEAFGLIYDERAVEPLIALLTSNTAIDKERVIVVLGNYPDPRVIEPLIEKLGSWPRPRSDEMQNIRKAAAASLERLTGEKFDQNSPEWRKWWEKNKDTWKPKKPAKPQPVEMKNDSAQLPKIHIHVTDKDGKPVVGAKVNVLVQSMNDSFQPSMMVLSYKVDKHGDAEVGQPPLATQTITLFNQPSPALPASVTAEGYKPEAIDLFWAKEKMEVILQKAETPDEKKKEAETGKANEPKKQSTWQPKQHPIPDYTPPEVVELIKRLQSDDPKERCAAAKLLGPMKEKAKPAIPWLADMLHDPYEEPMPLFVDRTFLQHVPANFAAWALATMGRTAFSAVNDALADPDPWTRRQMAWNIGLADDPELIAPLLYDRKDRGPRLIEALKDRDPFVRAGTINSLAKLTRLKELNQQLLKRAVEPLLAALADENPAVRRQAVRAFESFHDARAIDALVKSSLGKEDFSVRMEALFVLRYYRDPRVVEPLIEALGSWPIARSDEMLVFRQLAAQSLEALTGEKFGENSPEWRKWWAKNREKWKPEVAVAPAEPAPDAPKSNGEASSKEGSSDKKPAPEESSEWGKSNAAGLQIRISASKTVWAAGEKPDLALDLRNAGNEELILSPDPDTVRRLELDGKWYERGFGYDDGIRQHLKPGEERMGYFANLLALEWGCEKELTPGVHEVRIAWEAATSAPFKLVIQPAWGKPNADGLQIRAKVAKGKYTPEQPPTVVLDVRNTGKKPIAYIGMPQNECQIQVDGKWYAWPVSLPYSNRPLPLNPGEERLGKMEISLSDEWLQKPEKTVPLKLLPGRHEVRIAFQPEAAGAEAISEPVFIEVAADDSANKSPDATNKTGKAEAEKQEGQPDKLSLKSLPEFSDGGSEYRVAPYLKAAVELQKLSEEQRTAALRALCNAKDSGHGPMILCRMLFTHRPDKLFRAPHLGSPALLNGTDRSDWPLEPIELVDDVPFLIVHEGYVVNGRSEPTNEYLDYCLAECDWSTTKYAEKTPRELEAALQKLLASKKWKQPLAEAEQEFLKNQIREAKPGELSLKLLPDFLSEPSDYRAAPYLKMAVELQKLDEKQRTTALQVLCKAEGNVYSPIILCRMLFTNRPGKLFRDPELGAPHFLSDTDRADWPLEPIEFVDGVPFLIVTGYLWKRLPAPASEYLDYCLAECDWSTTKYAEKTPQELEAALQKLLISKKWKKPLAEAEQVFLKNQIREAKAAKAGTETDDPSNKSPDATNKTGKAETEKQDGRPGESSLKSLPDFLSKPSEYRAAPYLKMAVELQKLDEKQRAAALQALGKAEGNAYSPIILCRMLFTNRPGKLFRDPGLGAPHFLSNTDRADWSLEPIELVGGVPFLIVTGYLWKDLPAPASVYLDYCLAECDWSTTKYAEKTPQELEAALQKLLASKKWKKPLDDWEQEFLKDQIREPKPVETGALPVKPGVPGAEAKAEQPQILIPPIDTMVTWSDRKGRVLDNYSKPISGAQVRLSWISGYLKGIRDIRPLGEVVSDEDGYFKLPKPSNDGNVIGSVKAKGYFGRGFEIGREEKKPLVLRLGRTVAVRGQVLGLDGKPLAGAPLTLSAYFQFKHAVEGSVGGGGFPDSISADGDFDRAVTDDQGRFEFPAVPPGRHLIQYPWNGASKPDIEKKRWEKFIPSGKTAVQIPVPGVIGAAIVTVREEDGDVNSLRIPLNFSNCAVEGRLLDEQNNPVPGIKVALAWRCDADNGQPFFGPSYPPAVTDAEGRFHLEKLPPGRWCLSAWGDQKEGWYSAGLQDITLVSGKTIHFDIHGPMKTPAK